jgi:hypothetical protein
MKPTMDEFGTPSRNGEELKTLNCSIKEALKPIYFTNTLF